MEKIQEKFENGFTIIELIISILILSIGVVGIFSAFSIVTILTSDTADRLTATYLAQEGIEIVRNIRDENWLKMDSCSADSSAYGCPASWVDGLTSQGNSTFPNCENNGCYADYNASFMSEGSGGYFCTNPNGFYYYTNVTCDPLLKTKFQRKIIIIPTQDADNNLSPYHIIKVKSEVAWDQKASILNPNVKASAALSDDCVTNKNNCIIAEETLYNWYDTNISVTGVSIDNPVDNLTVNSTYQLTATVRPTDATNKNVVWSSDSNVITVDPTGKLTTGSPTGSAKITVTTIDGSKYDEDYITVQLNNNP